MLIGLAGWATAGKDAVADILVAEHGFEKRGMSDALCAVLYATNPMVDVGGDAGARWVRLRTVVDDIGWVEAKRRHPEVRRLQQRLGTEGGRAHLYEDVWVDAAFRNPPERLAVTGIRFPNEAEAVRKRGGEVWWVRRPGVGPANDHPSEHSLTDYPFDAVIDNAGGLDYLAGVVEQLVRGSAASSAA